MLFRSQAYHDVDECVGEYDECGVCNGDGVDADEDGVCDDVDDYKKAYIRVKREKDPKLSAGIIKSGFKYDPAMLGTQERFARGGLTRIVAPDSGSVSRGLRSLYIDDMD